ncbi:S41 family peptidase [Kaistella faecalis]|uniref:S41 family peptidase n=1 Tax=Kaistella faecalis TaxID=2852098 RepID=UPI001C462C9B|nr:S41 family peptidase [Chryseobacterium faecale]UFK96616.1 PDZ domain-containing protein [Chryseobacterium faecale]
MNTKILSGFTFVTLLLVSCSRDNDRVPAPNTETNSVNDFVWKAMNSWYYWQPNVPKLADNFKNSAEYLPFINSKTPDGLFYSLLYDYGNTDRFSWIENNNTIMQASRVAEVEKISGFDYAVYPKDNTNTSAVALVNYVVPGSPAASAGIIRGDIITKVNGAPLTLSNYSQLSQDQFTLTRAATAVMTSSALVTTDRAENISITKTNIDENPVAFYKKYNYGGKNIGYLVYNGFKSDYNDELNAAFATMKADGITELVLDLRYNGGGSLETATALAQMVNGNYTGQPYVYLDFNAKHNDEDGMDYLTNTVKTYNVVNGHPEQTGQQNVNSLNLSRIYVLVSFQTASASELTVSSLNKYVPVTTIGNETYGKFVGSITLYDSPASDFTSYATRNTSHNWKLQPITFSYYNKDRDPNPSGGILPTYAINPFQAINNIKEFGNVSDPELKKALELISGQTISKIAEIPVIYSNRNIRFQPGNEGNGLVIEDFESFSKNRK